MMPPSPARAEVTALPKVDTKCTAPSLIPTANGNTVRSFSTHGQPSAAKGSSRPRSHALIIRLIQHLDSSAHGLVRRWALTWLFPYPLITPPPKSGWYPLHRQQERSVHSIHWRPEYTARFPAVRTHARTHLQVHHGSPSQVRTRSPLQVRAR